MLESKSFSHGEFVWDSYRLHVDASFVKRVDEEIFSLLYVSSSSIPASFLKQFRCTGSSEVFYCLYRIGHPEES